MQMSKLKLVENEISFTEYFFIMRNKQFFNYYYFYDSER